MDLNLYFRVLRRFRVLVGVGFVLALLLATLAFVRVGFSEGSLDVTYRQSEVWASTSTVFVTQAGFPLGRATFDEVIPVEPTDGGTAPSYIPRYNDPNRFSGYAQLYARVASSDILKRRMLEDGPLEGQVGAIAGTDAKNPGIALPFVDIQGSALTPDAARRTADRGTRALIAYVSEQQEKNAIPRDKRVILRVLNEPNPAVLLVARSKARPVFIFIAVLMAFVALAFVLENVRPRVRAVAVEPVASADKRRSA